MTIITIEPAKYKPVAWRRKSGRPDNSARRHYIII